MKHDERTDGLRKLTGLSNEELAEVFANNPRAYMAVKGAVAEKHLEKIFLNLKNKGAIHNFRRGEGDFEKDFYVCFAKEGKEIAVECKNIRVIGEGTRDDKISYTEFLLVDGYLSPKKFFSWARDNLAEYGDNIAFNKNKNLGDVVEVLRSQPTRVINEFRKQLPQSLRESGLSRYSFSAAQLQDELPLTPKTAREYLHQFDDNPLRIDFKRTRNTTASPGEDPKAQRFYKTGEIDIVAACLFSRTLQWEFIYCNKRNLPRHPKHKQRYWDALQVIPDHWKSSLLDAKN